MALQPRAAGPIGLNRGFISRSGDELVIREKVMSLSGDSFDVMSAMTKMPVVKVKGEAFSWSGRKHVMAPDGSNMFDIRKPFFTWIFPKYYLQDESGAKLLEVKSRFSFGKSKATITFNNLAGRGEPVELLMEGNFFARKAKIVEVATGQPLVEIKKQSLNAGNLFAGQQTYTAVVAPGVDLSMVVAMCVCFDESNNEKQQ